MDIVPSVNTVPSSDPWGGDGGVRGGMYDGAGRGRLDYRLITADHGVRGRLRGGCHGLPLLILHQMVPEAKLDNEVEGAIHTSEVVVNG